MNLDYKKIGKFIAKLRKECNYTQEKLAEMLFVDRTTISKWEQGQNNINTDMLLKLSKIFDVTINEIIVGERKNSKNITEINDVTVKAIKKNKKLKKALIVIFCFVVVLFVIFLSFYFINNYNSIMVYEVHGENENISLHDGLVIISKDKIYINLGNIDNKKNLEVISSELYYKKDNKNFVIYKISDFNNYTFSSYYKDSLLQYKDLEYVISNLYFKVSTKENNFDLKLNLVKSYSNNSFFSKNSLSLNENEINKESNQIPEYVKQNFKLDTKEKCYSLFERENDISITYLYYYEAKVYSILENYNDYTVTYTYTYPDLSYLKVDKLGNVIEEFVYVMDRKKCLLNDCSDEKINYFQKKYFKYIE